MSIHALGTTTDVNVYEANSVSPTQPQGSSNIFSKAREQTKSNPNQGKEDNSQPCLWKKEIVNMYKYRVKDFLNSWAQKKSQLPKLKGKDAKKLSKEFEKEKEKLKQEIYNMISDIADIRDKNEAITKQIYKEHGVGTLITDDGPHYILDKGFNNPFAYYAKDPMQFYDESLLSDEEKAKVEEYKNSAIIADGAGANVHELSDLLYDLNMTTFESLQENMDQGSVEDNESTEDVVTASVQLQSDEEVPVEDFVVSNEDELDNNSETQTNTYNVEEIQTKKIRLKNGWNEVRAYDPNNNLIGSYQVTAYGNYKANALEDEDFDATLNRLGITDEADINAVRKANPNAANAGRFSTRAGDVYIPKSVIAHMKRNDQFDENRFMGIVS